MNKLNIKNMFVAKEALASVALSKDETIQTFSEGLTNNFKLYNINVKIKNKHTDQTVWQGPIAQVSNHFGRF